MLALLSKSKPQALISSSFSPSSSNLSQKVLSFFFPDRAKILPMSCPNQFKPFVPFMFLLLVSTSLFSPKVIVFGSPPAPPPPQEPTFINRPDPLQHFKNYNGCYDPRSKHYWASAAFTGIYGYTIAVVWLLCGVIFGVFTATKHIISRPSPISDFSDHYYFVMFMLILLLTILVLIASGFALAANQGSMNRAKKLKRTVLSASGDAYRTIRKVMTTLTKMQIMLHPYTPETTLSLKATNHRLRSEAKLIHTFVHDNEPYIELAINASYRTHLVVVTVNLVLLVVGLVMLVLHWHPGFIVIIFACWILTTLCWILAGFDFSLQTFAEDTCSALQKYEQNPVNNTLASMLPCPNSSQSNKMLIEIGSTAHGFITQLNWKIEELYRSVGVNRENENLMGVRQFCVCDPFSETSRFDYSPGSCPKDAIEIGELPNVLARFTCYKDTDGEDDNDVSKNCLIEGKFIPESSYNMAWAFSGSLQDLLTIYPDLQNLSDCSFVKDTFYDVYAHQCKPFTVSIQLLWCSMLCLSIFMVLLVLVLVTKVYQDKGRRFSFCSISPTEQA